MASVGSFPENRRRSPFGSPALIAAAAGAQFQLTNTLADGPPRPSKSIASSEWLKKFQEAVEIQKRQQQSLLLQQQRQIEELKKEQDRVQAELERQKRSRNRSEPTNDDGDHEKETIASVESSPPPSENFSDKENAADDESVSEDENIEESLVGKMSKSTQGHRGGGGGDDDDDERPIRPALRNDEESFDQFVVAQMQLERQGGMQLVSTPSKASARTFLKKGQGLARFLGPKQAQSIENDVKKDEESDEEEDGQSPDEDDIIPDSSFQIRSKERLKHEEEELEEFEMLERAVDETSFSSQCSLVRTVISRASQPKQMEEKDKRNESFHSEESVSLSTSVSSTLVDDEEREDCVESNELEFDDKETWDEEEEEEQQDAHEEMSTDNRASSIENPLSSRPAQRKVYRLSNQGEQSRGMPLDSSSSSSSDDEDEDSVGGAFPFVGSGPKSSSSFQMASSPPTSALVAKLFPALQKSATAASASAEVTAREPKQQAATGGRGDDESAAALREKLADLEREIERFKAENSAVTKLKAEREKALSDLHKEKMDFKKWQEEQLAEFESLKESEMQKLRKERRVFEQHRVALQNKPDKQEREEIAALRKENDDLRRELERREKRWNAASERFKARISVLEKENGELKDEVRQMEEQRLKNWMQSLDVSEEKKTAGKMSPDTVIQSRKKEAQPARKMAEGPRKKLADQTGATSLPSSSIKKVEKSGVRQPKKAVHFIDDSVSSSDGEEKRPLPVKTNLSADKVKKIQHSNGKVEEIRPDGSRAIAFSDGTKKEISADGLSIIVSFSNGDVRHIFPDQKVIYFYAETKTKHTTYPDGLEVLEFESGQVEKHYPDGTKEIIFIDQTVKYLFSNGSSESLFPDGTVERVAANGDKTIEFANGQKEIHTAQYKRREYPDGTVKTVFNDGRQETRYSSGRIRIKDSSGNIIADSMTPERRK
ncbi:centromere protein J-like isoform X2 [Oscarella lobularis]